MKYSEYLRSGDWQDKRRRKKLRANHCAICNSKNNLEVHHLNYKNLFDAELSDLRVLCHDCHFFAHELHRAGKFKFKSTNHNSRFALLKNAVKRERGIFHTNLFYPKDKK